MGDCDGDSRTLWCGNLSDKVTEEVLYELFLQAAPLEKVKIPKDKEGRLCKYAFVTFKHIDSVEYVLHLLNGTILYDKEINLQKRNSNSGQRYAHQMIQYIPPESFMLDNTNNVNMFMCTGGQQYIDKFAYNEQTQFTGRWERNNHRDYRRHEDSRPYRVQDHIGDNNYSDARGQRNNHNRNRNNSHSRNRDHRRY